MSCTCLVQPVQGKCTLHSRPGPAPAQAWPGEAQAQPGPGPRPLRQLLTLRSHRRLHQFCIYSAREPTRTALLKALLHGSRSTSRGTVLQSQAICVTNGHRSKCGGLECCLAPPQLGDSPSVVIGPSGLRLCEHTHAEQTPNKNKILAPPRQ